MNIYDFLSLRKGIFHFVLITVYAKWIKRISTWLA